MIPPSVDNDDRRQFVLDNTRLLNPPLVPEIVLHLAEESLPLWEKTEEQLGKMNVPPPYWAFAWAGGQALARYTLDHPDVVRNAHVIDLGAGSGLCAIAASLAGAADVLAADVDPFSEHAMALNATVNSVNLRITVDDLLSEPPLECDVLLIGDLFYEKDLADRVMVWARTIAQTGGDVLVGDPNRSFFPVDSFEKVAEYSVPVTRALEDSEIKRTSVWRLPV
ncbi:MAG: class I SAM-dependent methyltransferase [Hyphomicrobiaceae bacterium]